MRASRLQSPGGEPWQVWSFPSKQKHRHTVNAPTHTQTHRHGPVGDNRKRNSDTTGTATGSKRQWVSVNDVMGSPPPLQQSLKASLFSEWILGMFLTAADP